MHEIQSTAELASTPGGLVSATRLAARSVLAAAALWLAFVDRRGRSRYFAVSRRAVAVAVNAAFNATFNAALVPADRLRGALTDLLLSGRFSPALVAG